MGKTLRNKIEDGEFLGNQRDKKRIGAVTIGKRMKAYATSFKFGVDHSTGNPHFRNSGMKTGVSRMGKLVTKNANRSLKKGLRQQLKKELRFELDKNE